MSRDLIKSRFSFVLIYFSKFKRFAPSMVRLACRIEGGELRSETARKIMAGIYGIEVGAYSYGSVMKPGQLPPGVKVGRYVSTAPNLQILFNHPIDFVSLHPYFYNSSLGYVKKDLIVRQGLDIGDDAWIGEGVKVTAGCQRIGIGAIVGAGTILTKDVPDFTIVAGNPSRVLRKRFSDEAIQDILNSRWWTKSIDELLEEIDAYTTPYEDESRDEPQL
ncbi:CatB-related O-acetyltransferase [Pontibacterium sp.]|uniref:CatB-related O-acetyltransferase n=1 Tax=Pontibacterium sp. TaxID=2036026 RepID=UPI0035667E73